MLRVILISFQILFFSTFQIKAEEVQSTVNLYGTTFIYGAPLWINTNDPNFKTTDLLKMSKNFRDQKGPSFILEAIPVNENFENWTTMFAVKAFNVGRKAPMGAWEDNTLATFRQVCGGLSIQYLEQQSDISLVQIICPKILGYNQDGYNDGVGEIGLFAFYVNNTTAISHYIEWRGNAFSPTNKAEWPVSEVIIQKAINDMKQTRAINENSIVSFNE